jgi:hypothetical protein
MAFMGAIPIQPVLLPIQARSTGVKCKIDWESEEKMEEQNRALAFCHLDESDGFLAASEC